LNGGLSTFTGVIFYLGIYTFTRVQLLSTFTTPAYYILSEQLVTNTSSSRLLLLYIIKTVIIAK